MGTIDPRKTGFWLWFTAWFSILFLWMMVSNHADLDLWGRMAMGALIHQNGAFPYHDPFSYTAPGAPWIDHEWGCGVVFYWTFLAFGSAGLFWLKIILLAAALLATAAIHLEMNRIEPGWGFQGSRMLVFLLALAATRLPITTGYLMTIRCQTFSFLFYLLFLWSMERLRLGTGRKTIWLLPLLMVLWVNLHGGFSYGFVILGLYCVWMVWDRRWNDARRLAAATGLCLAATLINPYGFRFLIEIVSAWTMERPIIAEWGSVFQSYKPRQTIFYSAFLFFWLIVGFLDWKKDYRRFPGIWLLILATAWQGYQHYKLMPFFVLTTAALGPRLDLSFVNRVLATVKTGPRIARILLLVLPILFLITVTGITIRQKLLFDDDFRALAASPMMRRQYPVDAARFILQNGIAGNLWCTFDSGEFLLWTLFPQFRISIDGRYGEVYPDQVMQDFVAFFREKRDIDAALKYPTTHILIPAERKDLAEALEESRRWTLIFRDDVSRLYAIDFPRIPVEKTASSRIVFLDYFLGDLRRFRLPDAATGKPRPAQENRQPPTTGPE